MISPGASDMVSAPGARNMVSAIQMTSVSKQQIHSMKTEIDENRVTSEWK